MANRRNSAMGARNRGGFRFRSSGKPVVNTRMTRGMSRAGFLRSAGMVGAGVAAAGL